MLMIENYIKPNLWLFPEDYYPSFFISQSHNSNIEILLRHEFINFRLLKKDFNFLLLNHKKGTSSKMNVKNIAVYSYI